MIIQIIETDVYNLFISYYDSVNNTNI